MKMTMLSVAESIGMNDAVACAHLCRPSAGISVYRCWSCRTRHGLQQHYIAAQPAATTRYANQAERKPAAIVSAPVQLAAARTGYLKASTC